LLDEPLHAKATPLPRESWESEVRWLEAFLAAGKPVLGVCLGMQLMAVHAGGGLIQDIPDQRPSDIPHAQEKGVTYHRVHIEPQSWLASVSPALDPEVASSHHQAAKDVPPGFRASAYAPDGLIEAIEGVGEPFFAGVQWHPEHSKAQPDWLLTAFVGACSDRTASALSQPAS
jgi:putative glutamine amidotransferase